MAKRMFKEEDRPYYENRIKSLTEEGLETRLIATRLGISMSAVNNIKRKLKLTQPRSRSLN